MSSIVAQRKAAIEAQLRTAASASISTPASASIAVSTQPSLSKKFNIKRVQKVPTKTKRRWGLSRKTYEVNPERSTPTPPRPSAPNPVPFKASSQPLSQPAVQHFVPRTVSSRSAPQKSPLIDVSFVAVPETISLQHSDQDDIDDSQHHSGNPSAHLQPSYDSQQHSVATEPSTEQNTQQSTALQRLKSRIIPVPSPPPRRKPVVREMADTNPDQEKEYQGTWQARKMVPPQRISGMPTPDMAAAAAQKYNQNQEKIQKAVRELEGEDKPPEHKEQDCCVIL